LDEKSIIHESLSNSSLWFKLLGEDSAFII